MFAEQINKWAKDQKEQNFWTYDNSYSFGNHTKKQLNR